MGGTNWSDAHYTDRVKTRAAAGVAAFAYDHDIKAGKTVAGVHKSLDPKGVVFRESRDSAEHPNAIPIVVLCDVTGSMSEVPRMIQAALPKLMGLLIRKGYAEHPAIMIGAIGDATCDKTPLQVGQFESGIEIENDLTNLYLEEGGGGQKTESYELAVYFVARHTVTDHWEKRGRKGYLFIIGDEMTYPKVKRDEVLGVIGDSISENIDTSVIVAEVKERWETFYVLPRMTSYFDDETVRKHWRGLVGQNLLLLDEPSGISELIAAQVGACEGTADTGKIADDLVDAGSTKAIATSVARALAPVASSPGLVATLPDSGAAGGLTNF